MYIWASACVAGWQPSCLCRNQWQACYAGMLKTYSNLRLPALCIYVHSHRIPALNHCTSQHNSPNIQAAARWGCSAISSILPFTGSSSDEDQHDYIRIKKQKQKSCIGMPCILIPRQKCQHILPNCHHHLLHKANKQPFIPYNMAYLQSPQLKL